MIAFLWDHWRVSRRIRRRVSAQGGLFAPDRFDVFPDDEDGHAHDIDAGGNCRADGCVYNSDINYWKEAA